MKYTADRASNEKLYMQLYYQLREDIIKKRFSYGDKLPSKRLLAEETSVSVISVMRAYDILCDEGYIEPRQRSGYYVVYRENDFSSVPSREEDPFTGISPRAPAATEEEKYQFPYSVIAKTMRRVISEMGGKMLERSPNKGILPLRREISRYLSRSCGINAPEERIVIGAGAEYLYNIILLLLGTDRIFAYEYPSYEKIGKVYEANSVRTERLPLGKDGIKSRALEGSEATVLHVTPFNSYPSHITASPAKRREYVSWAEKRGGYIIEDNYYSELTLSKKHEDTLFSTSDRVIYVNTFSQTVSPSFRVGYAIIPEALSDVFEKRVGFYSCAVPVFEQYVLCELIRSGDFERHINRVRRAKRKEKNG